MTHETVCKSVVGGWQSFNPDMGGLFGPVFNKTTDLWDWQRDNLTPSGLVFMGEGRGFEVKGATK